MSDAAALTLRSAALSDLGALAHLFRVTRETCLPFLPQLHTRAEDLEFFRTKVFLCYEVTVAEAAGQIAGYSAVAPGWLEQLYVLPQFQKMGAGSALLRQARQGQPALQFWVFQKNVAARRFYESHGARIVRLTAGAENEEREPDALYEFRPAPELPDASKSI